MPNIRAGQGNGSGARLFTVFAVRSAGGRPPREKSQSKSQRRPTSGDTRRRQATVKPGQVPTERHWATPSDARNVTGGQGVVGSNPAVPTGNRIFSNIVTPHKSQQKSQLVVQRRADRVPRPPYGACANTAEPTKPHSQRVKDHRAAPHLHGDPANGEPADTIRAHPRYSIRGTRAGQVLTLGLPTPSQTRGSWHESHASDRPPRP